MKRLAAIALALVALAVPVGAQESDPVNITADKFVVDDVGGIATFTGNVVVKRKKLTVWAPKVVAKDADRPTTSPTMIDETLSSSTPPSASGTSVPRSPSAPHRLTSSRASALVSSSDCGSNRITSRLLRSAGRIWSRRAVAVLLASAHTASRPDTMAGST